MIKYNLKQINEKIWLLSIDDYEHLALSFLRYQEFYENPKFKDKIFTIKKFAKWYEKYGSFSYAKDWAGFNLPLDVIKQVNDLVLRIKTIMMVL